MTPRYLLCYTQYCITPLLVVSQDTMNDIIIIVPGPRGAVEPPPAAALPRVQTIVTPKQL